MKRLLIAAVLVLTACTSVPKPDCTVTTLEGHVLDVYATRGHGSLKEYKVLGPYTGGWISTRTLASTTCSK